MIRITQHFAGIAIACAALIAAPAAAQSSPAVGKWDIVAATQMGELKSTMTVTEANGAYSVDVVDAPMDAPAGAPAMGEMTSTISDVAVNGPELTFTRSLSGAMAMKLSYKLTVEGDTLKGEAGSDFGPTAITGTRAQ